MLVFVQDCNGNALNPTERCGRVRHLLKQKKAMVVMMNPFTIRLTEPRNKMYTQPYDCGIDAGTVHVGVSITDDKKEVFAATFNIRSHEVHELLDTKKDNRRSRRQKKCYRKPRFSNRKREKGWLPPSVEHRIFTHEKVVEYVMKLLPIKSITIEIGQFDTQKMKNPDISGSEYQHGEKEGYENVKAYVRARDRYTCQICHPKSSESDDKKSGRDAKIEVHHIIYESNGGPTVPSNLVCLCHSCHQKLHNGKAELPEKFDANKKSIQFLRDAALMNMFSMKVYEKIRDSYPNLKVNYTYGYITNYYRLENNITKTHAHDARVISGNPAAEPAGCMYEIRQGRRHIRKLTEYQPRQRKAKYDKNGNKVKDAMPRKKRRQLGYVIRTCEEIKQIHGFTKRSIVLYNQRKCVITGLRRTGFFSLVDCKTKQKYDSVKYTEIKLIHLEHKSFYVENVRKL